MSTITTSGNPTGALNGYGRPREVASYLGVSRGMVYKLIREGRLPYIEVGEAKRIPWDAVFEYTGRQLVPASQ